MAQSITTYKTIKTIRSELKDICTKLQKITNNFPTNTYQTKGGAKMNAHGLKIEKWFNSAEGNLTSAHKAANALGSIKTNPKAAKLSFNIAKYSASKGIRIKSEDATSDIISMNAYIVKLEEIKGIINKCYKEIDSLNVTEQLISSMTVIDLLFPTNGISKYMQIAMVKEIGTINLKQAKQDVEKIIKYFKKLKTDLTKSISQFDKCEGNVKKKSYEDTIAATTPITESSNTSEKEMKDKISQLEEKQKQYVYLYGEECPEIATEIARLKKLYNRLSVEGRIKQSVEDAIQNEQGNGGSKYKKWFYDNYGGLNPNGNFGWCDRFVSWLLGQMGFRLPEGGCSYQMNAFKNKNGYYAHGTRTPQTGDVVFFDWDNNGSPNHVGIIHIDEQGETWVIHGNFGNKVCYNKISDVMRWNGGSIMGYGDPTCLGQL